MVYEREEGQEGDDVERFRLETTEEMVWRQSTALFQGMGSQADEQAGGGSRVFRPGYCGPGSCCRARAALTP
jgi:hypothetical protein